MDLKSKTVAIPAFCIFLFFFIYFLYTETNRINYVCNNLDKGSEALNPSSLEESIQINNLYIKSSFNSCCIGGMKNDYVDLCAINNCYKKGARCLDFQIFSLNEEPIISCSTSKSFEYKELYNYLSFSETMDYIKKKFMNTSDNINNNYPLFLNFRIHTNNIIVLNKMYNHLVKIFDNNGEIYKNDGGVTSVKNFNNKTLEDLKGRVIIMIDKNSTPENKVEIEQSKLYDLAIIIFGENGNHAVNYSESNINIINELSATYPEMNIYSNNYDSSLYGFKKNHSFIFMNFQIKDVLLNQYLGYFNNQSFVIKPDSEDTLQEKRRQKNKNPIKNIMNKTKYKIGGLFPSQDEINKTKNQVGDMMPSQDEINKKWNQAGDMMPSQGEISDMISSTEMRNN